ncbi:lipoprotein-releasing system permease protein [Azospirillum fermentarium]|uniref:lipoprotein-releasing ABC transporter permease subunit n=1 Tax=Azospirillum fermentarium TaxID=1233114 RepID=UPI002227EF28|nr:lipoprotein-releasing ABC transporter permease subunit [Azospirillum fermentarium]MCW2248366.1 lipoprotein-releasing system permease protein [Azospirillum fermentarium]
MMFSPLERLIAMRYLRARRQEGFISVIAGFSFLGIALGVATLIVVMAVMNGFRGELMGRVLGLNGHLTVKAVDGGPLPAFDPLADELRRLPGVITVMPLVEGQALVSARGAALGAQIRGVRAEDFRNRPSLANRIVRGSAGGFGDDRLAVGYRMAQRLAIGYGGEDVLTLTVPQTDVKAFGTAPRARAFPVAAVFDVNMAEVDNSTIFMPLEAAQSFFGLAEGQATALELFVLDPMAMDQVRAAVEKTVGARGRVLGWQQVNSSLFTALQVERTVMFIILTLIILVAAFNIISSLMMLVKEKGRDVAILRTMGASRGMVMRIFLLSGASVGVVGTLAGFVLGVVLAGNMDGIGHLIELVSGGGGLSPEAAFLSRLPARIAWGEVTLVVVMGLVLSVGATLYPSWRAARLDPVEALRYE